MATQRRYYEDLSSLLAFLATKPTDTLYILIGTDSAVDNVTNDLFQKKLA